MTQQINKQFIVVDGPDGIGKSTQVELLVQWLRAQVLSINNGKSKINIRAENFKEFNSSNTLFADLRNFIYSIYKKVPTTHLAEIIKINRNLAYEGLIDDYTVRSQVNLFSSTNIINYREIYNKYVAVCDRWNISTYCYLKAEDYEDEALSYLIDDKTVIPGLTIMLVGDNGCLRFANRPENNNMFEDNEQDYNKKLANVYKNFDTLLYSGKVIKINNDNKTKEETQMLIRKNVLNYLKGIWIDNK